MLTRILFSTATIIARTLLSVRFIRILSVLLCCVATNGNSFCMSGKKLNDYSRPLNENYPIAFHAGMSPYYINLGNLWI
jgi:hypothetical protein